MDREIVVGGSKVAVLEDGAGEPTLLLHGNPDSKEIWRPLIERLKDRCHSFAPDLPGFGASALPDDFDMSLESQAGWVDGVVESLALREPITLVVHDVGGPFGLAWAVTHPEKVRRIVVLNTLFHASYRWHAWARVWRAPLLGELSMLGMNRPLFVHELRRGSRKLSTEQIHDAYTKISPTSKRAVLRWYRAMDPEKLAGWEERLVTLVKKVPSLVVWGDHDPYIGKEFAERFGAKDVHHVSDVGHWVQAEAPDEVAKHIRAMLAG